MSLSYREYEIFYDDPGITIHRATNGYGSQQVVYKKKFTTIEDGLMYIAERVSFTDNTEIKTLLDYFKVLRADLKTIAQKLLPKITADTTEKDIGIPEDIETKEPSKKVIKKIIKKSISA